MICVNKDKINPLYREIESGVLMIKQLRNIFPSLLVYTDEILDSERTYKWFMTDTKEIIGILEEELTAKDLSLLTTFLTPYNIQFPPYTDEEKKWRKVIYSSELKDDLEPFLTNPYRFVYFSFNQNQMNPITFKDAIQELFAKPIPILWESAYEGIIIEEQAGLQDDSMSFEQIVDILMSDLYVKIYFFVGPYQKDWKDIAQHFQALKNMAKKVFMYSNKTVVSYIEAVPFLLINETESDLRANIGKTVLQEYVNDAETLKMIETFVQYNLNISETAKVLHMHRNSLQYRLDRFLEKTGIDIRQFHHAMTVYLALLTKK